MRQSQLFVDSSIPKVSWELPDFRGEATLGFDYETDSLAIHRGASLVGFSLATLTGESVYVPFAHRRGFNYDPDKAKQYLVDQIRGKRLWGTNIKFENAISHNWGLSLEDLGCELHDIQNGESLLSSKRTPRDLASIAERRHPTKRKIEFDGDIPIHERHSEQVEHYARVDAELAIEIGETYQRELLDKEGLINLRNIEDSLIFMLGHMERNGVLVNRPLLEQWCSLARQRQTRIFWQLAEMAGFKVEPGDADSITALCVNKLKMQDVPKVRDDHDWKRKHKAKCRECRRDFVCDAGRSPSIKNTWLAKKRKEYPILGLVYNWRKLQDLRSDCLDKFLHALDGNNKLYYNLNQLQSDEHGIVSGRISSTGQIKNPDDDLKVGIATVIKVDEDDDDDAVIADMPIRQLFIPPVGKSWIRADASQLQFRIFAHLSQDFGGADLIRAYNEDPTTDFHTMMTVKILRWVTAADAEAKNALYKAKRQKAKHENFGKLFGMGAEKGAARAGMSVEEYKETVVKPYDHEFPAAKKMHYKTQELARHPSLGPHPITGKMGRGYLFSMSGRRLRFDPNDSLNAALAQVIQAYEADYTKIMNREVYRERKNLNLDLLFPVYDELDGLAPTESVEETQRRMAEILNDFSPCEAAYNQRFKVPIIWDVKAGTDWHECS